MRNKAVNQATVTKEIFLKYLNELPEPVQRAIEFTLANWSELKIVEAQNLLACFPTLPKSPQDANDETRAKLSAAISTLKNNPEIWLSLENLPQEIWRSVVGYEKDYMVSNYGRVKSFRRGKPKIFQTSMDKDGYELVFLSGDKFRKNARVHILVAQAFIANIENKSEVNHWDAVKNNNCVWNLVWATGRENCEHARRMGLIKTGSDSPLAKLLPERVKEVRETYIPRDSEFGATALAEKIGVSRRTVTNAANYKTYKDLP